MAYYKSKSTKPKARPTVTPKAQAHSSTAISKTRAKYGRDRVPSAALPAPPKPNRKIGPNKKTATGATTDKTADKTKTAGATTAVDKVRSQVAHLPPRRDATVGGPTPGRPNPPKAERQAAFLEAYLLTGVISAALQASDVPRTTYDDWMRMDPEFRQRFGHTHEAVVDEAEQELKRRGIHGTLEPVFYQGEICGHVTRKSDACLIFYLKGRRADIFKDKSEIAGPGGGPVQVVDLSNVPTERLQQMREWLKEAQVAAVPSADKAATVATGPSDAVPGDEA